MHVTRLEKRRESSLPGATSCLCLCRHRRWWDVTHRRIVLKHFRIRTTWCQAHGEGWCGENASEEFRKWTR